MSKKPETETPPPSPAIDFAADAGAGTQNISDRDMGVPFLNIAQSLTPETKKSSDEYVPGLEEGDVFDNIGKQIICKLGSFFEVVPLAYIRVWVEWKPRTAGGGVVETHFTDTILRQCHRDEKGKFVLPNGNVVEETATFHVKAWFEGEWKPFIIAMKSSQLGPARQWLRSIRNIRVSDGRGGFVNPAIFSHRYKLSTKCETNKVGQPYMNWAVSCAGPVVSAEDYAAFRAACEQAANSSFRALPAPESE